MAASLKTVSGGPSGLSGTGARGPFVGAPGVAQPRATHLGRSIYPPDLSIPAPLRYWTAAAGGQFGTRYTDYGAWLDYSMYGAFSARHGDSGGYYQGYEGVARERPEVSATCKGDMVGNIELYASSGAVAR